MALYLLPNEGKLLLNGSQLAGSRSCCCEDRDDCDVCADLCILKLEIVSPLAVSAPQPCLGLFEKGANAATEAHPACLEEIFGYKRYFATLSPNVIFNGWPSSYGVINIRTDEYVAEISVVFTCETLPNTYKVKWYLRTYFLVYGEALPIRGQTIVLKQSVRELASSCQTKQGDNCFNPPIGRQYFSTPITLTMNAESDGIGAWQSEQQEAHTSACLDDLLENFSATFRMTQWPSCVARDCNCGVNLDGLKAFFEGKEFTLGTDEIITDGNTTYEHYNEPITGAYQFFKTVYSPGDENCPVPPSVISLTDLSLTCETDNSVIPAVVRWLTTVTTSCTPVEIVDCEVVPTGFASRLFTGNIPCYEAEDNCAGPVGGTHIPVGSPLDVVEDEDSPFLDPGLPNCGAPNFPDFRIEQACGA